MMMHSRVYHFFLLLLLFLSAAISKGQSSVKETVHFIPVGVGDTLPDYRIGNMINYTAASARLSDFKGKWMILDLWSSTCSGCLAAMPKLLQLQKEFDGKLQIILLNPWENKTKVRELYERRKKASGLDITLPTSCRDTSLLKWIPAATIPHVAWIDGDRVVRSITYSESLNAKNIAALLNGQPVNMQQKSSSDALDFKASEALFVNRNGGEAPQVYWQSILTKGEINLWRGIGIEASKWGYYCTGTNASIAELYQQAYTSRYNSEKRLSMLNENRIRLEVEDSTRYLYMVNGETNFDHLYNYHLIAPASSAEQLQAWMREDLKRYFGLEVRWEKRKTKCLVLTANDTTRIGYRSGESSLIATVKQFKINKVSVEKLIFDVEYSLEYGQRKGYPIIDETGYKGLLGLIEGDIDSENYKSLDNVLNKVGMHLTLTERVIPLLILKESDDREIRNRAANYQNEGKE